MTVIGSADWSLIYTYRDLVYRMLEKRGLGGSDRELALMQSAINSAYFDLPSLHSWRFYTRRHTFYTSPAVSYATATYDQTGGAYERMLTLSSGVWPSDAEDGEVVIGDNVFHVDRRVSDTVVTLSDEMNPGADMTGAVSWQRPFYRLPSNIKDVRELWQSNNRVRLTLASFLDAGRMYQFRRTAGTPQRFSIEASRTLFGATDIRLIPCPATAQVYEVLATVRPMPMRVFHVGLTNDGTCTTSSTTFTSANASFDSSLVGCVIRINQTSTDPKSPNSYIKGGVDYGFQSMVRSVTNSTTLELANAATFSGSACGYSISSPCDIDPYTQLNFFEALAWQKYCEISNVGREQYEFARSVAQEALRAAMAAERSANFDHEPALVAPWWSTNDVNKRSRVNFGY